MKGPLLCGPAIRGRRLIPIGEFPGGREFLQISSQCGAAGRQFGQRFQRGVRKSWNSCAFGTGNLFRAGREFIRPGRKFIRRSPIGVPIEDRKIMAQTLLTLLI